MTKSVKPREGKQEQREQAKRDVPDPRTKSGKHGKTTADKWNQ